jgi:hypothetical protein
MKAISLARTIEPVEPAKAKSSVAYETADLTKSVVEAPNKPEDGQLVLRQVPKSELPPILEKAGAPPGKVGALRDPPLPPKENVAQKVLGWIVASSHLLKREELSRLERKSRASK